MSFTGEEPKLKDVSKAAATRRVPDKNLSELSPVWAELGSNSYP